MIKTGSVIRHKKFLDVCCLVDSVNNEYFLVTWINTGFVKSYKLPVEQQIIRINNTKDWQICVDTSKSCLRHSIWVDL